MSDQFPPAPSSGGDRMRDTLTALRVDLSTARLADADQVRRRGQARNRHQVIAGLAAAVVVVAVAIGGASLFTGGGAGRDPNTIATNPPEPKPLSLAADPFLRTQDIDAVGPYASFQRNPDPVPEDQRPLACIPSPTSLGAGEARGALFFSDLDARFIEHVLRFDDAAAATAAVAKVSSSFATCNTGKPAEVSVADRGPELVSGGEGDTETLRASRLTTPTADADIAYYELAIVRSANVVVVLEWSSMGKPDGAGSWVWSTERLGLAASRTTP